MATPTGINEGTQTFMQTDAVGTTVVPYVKLDVGAAGLSVPFTNTIGSITRIVGGTLGVLASGTVTGSTTLGDGVVNPADALHTGAFLMGYDGASTWYRIVSTNSNADALGTSLVGLLSDARLRIFNGTTWDRLRGDTTSGVWVQAKLGTVDTVSQLPPNSWGTVVSSGTNTLGTIKPSVAGSQIFVTYLIISTGSASNVTIASGGTSTPIAGTFFFNANGGIVATPLTPPLVTASGSPLVYQQSTGGPITVTAGGFVR